MKSWAGRLALLTVFMPAAIVVAGGPGMANTCLPRSIQVNDVAAPEGDPPGGGTLVFTVSTSGCQAGNASYHIVAGPLGTSQATVAVDYLPVNGVLTWNTGDMTNRTVVVPIVGDNVVEKNETLSLRLFNPAGLTLTDAIGVGTIIDDDELKLLSEPECPEDCGVCRITVAASEPVAFDVTVHFATRDGTAIAGPDYRAVRDRVLTIPAGQTRAEAEIVIYDDGAAERDEFFYVTIFQPSAGVIGDGEAILTITSD